MNIRKEIQSAYQVYVLQTGRRPHQLEDFSESALGRDLPVAAHYQSPAEISRDIVLASFERSLARLAEAPEFGTYSAREQALAFYFTWLEELQPLKSFLRILDQATLPGLSPSYLKAMEEPFKAFIADLLAAAQASGELASRSLIANRYSDIFWAQTRFLLHQWLRDESPEGERSDALVEKTVNFCFDLLNPNLIDSGIDLIKFLISR